MKKIKTIKGEWIYWRWKGNKTFLKSYVQDCIPTLTGMLLELSDSHSWTNYPNRVLMKEINILKENNPQPK